MSQGYGLTKKGGPIRMTMLRRSKEMEKKRKYMGGGHSKGQAQDGIPGGVYPSKYCHFGPG